MVAALAASAVLAATAFGHAQLLSSKPEHGAALERSPRSFTLTFDEAIAVEFVQLSVEDARGRRADRGEPYHPRGREEVVAVRLRPDLDGTYVARYRVLSEDGHPVGRRTVFEVRAPERRAGAAPMAPGASGPPMAEAGGEHGESGGVTDTAFAAARGAGYLAIALAVGGLAFLVAVWLPALAREAGADPAWRATSRTFVGRVRGIVLGAALLGLVATAAAIVLEAATAAGITFWAALDASLIESLSDTRVVQAWGARLVLWLLLGFLVVLVLRPRRAPVLRRAALGAEGAALAPMPALPLRLSLVAAVLALALTAPMAGHTGTHSPRGLLVFADAAHVLCMSVWLGGLVMLLLALPVAGRALSPRERTPFLAGLVGRFSRLALAAVGVLVLTGAIQSIALVGSFSALVETAYGRLVLVKIAALVVLVALGAHNQRRSLPRLRRLAGGGEEPGRAVAVLRRAVAAEVALVIGVLGVTSVLVTTQPPGG